MKIIKYIVKALLASVAATWMSGTLAHLMHAQRGTLNFSEDGAYLVLSLPMAAFAGVDSNLDGEVSLLEFNIHREVILTLVQERVSLVTAAGQLKLDGIIVSPQVENDSLTDSVSQVVLLGRFSYQDIPGNPVLQLDLYGKRSTEQSVEIVASRQSDGYQKTFTLTSRKQSAQLFE